MTEEKRMKKGSEPRHGKSYGECIKCGVKFPLKKHHGHRAGTVVLNGICRSCSEKIKGSKWGY
jgi:hypothetical protein